MKIVNDINTIKPEGYTAVTIGKFEALHKGHQRLIGQIAACKTKGLIPTVLTFKRASVSLQEEFERKQFLEDSIRHAFLEKLGIELLVEIEFNKAFADLLPEEFVKKVLIDKLCAKEIVTGTNFRFGKDRGGDTMLLSRLSEKYGYKYHTIDLEKYGDVNISTTYAKELLRSKNYEILSQILGAEYPIHFGG